jgi:prophage tail gpP-like protein
MSKAVPGGVYVVVKGDTLWGIAGQAYGNVQRWPEIYEANKGTVGSDPNLIFPGQSLFIPGDTPLEVDVEDDSELLPGADPNGMVLVIGGKEIPVESSVVLRTMDTGSDTWTAEVYWDPSDAELTALYKPYSFLESKAYVGGQLLVTGPLMISEPVVNNDKVSMQLTGFSKTIHMVDSYVKPPYQRNDITLVDLAGELVKGRSVKIVDNTQGAADGAFPRATAETSDKEFDFLAKMARQKTVLLTSTPRGDLLLTQTADKTDNFGSIGDDQARGHDWRARFNSRDRYREIRMLGKRRGKKVASSVVVDKNIKENRSKTIQDADLSADELEKAAQWERSKSVAEALSIPFPVSGWYAPDGRLWRENKYVTVVSSRIFVPDGFDFLIRSVEYHYTREGRKSVLNLVPPGVFTSEPVEEPWFQ